MELPCRVDDTERCRIRSTECISKGVVSIRIRCSHSSADVLSGCRVFGDGSGCAIAIGEHGCAVLIDIRDLDGETGCTDETGAIRRPDGEIGVSVLGFIIQGGFGAHLPCVGINTKRVRIAPAK